MTKVEATLKKYKGGFTIRIPKEAECLFPLCRVDFSIKSSAGVDTVHVSPDSPPHIHVTKMKWFKAHPELREGDKLVIEVVGPEGKREYYLRKLEEQKEVV